MVCANAITLKIEHSFPCHLFCKLNQKFYKIVIFSRFSLKMPKHEKGTPKEIANRHKSKGLQKLKWFCQMCQKQCRDQNGFKCHLTSEAHQRQMLLFADNQNSYLREFSREFEANFIRVSFLNFLNFWKILLQILRSTFGCKRVKANDVYQEYVWFHFIKTNYLILL